MVPLFRLFERGEFYSILLLEKLKLIFRYISYYFRAKTYYKVHSPFVFEFCEEVLEDDRHYYAFELLEGMRKELYKNDRKIHVTDFGAGSHVSKSNERTISSIAKSAVSPIGQSKMLFRLVNHYQPGTMLEFGTSLGLTALYQSLPVPKSKMISLEGCPNISAVAQLNFNFAKADNIQLKTGAFEHTLQKALEEFPGLDYVFFDGNHRKEPTLAYFESCLEKAHENSIFIFDDIHWSEEMESAWSTIIQYPQVTLSLDLFFMGIVFFRKENNEKEHFTLIPSFAKPWTKFF